MRTICVGIVSLLFATNYVTAFSTFKSKGLVVNSNCRLPRLHCSSSDSDSSSDSEIGESSSTVTYVPSIESAKVEGTEGKATDAVSTLSSAGSGPNSLDLITDELKELTTGLESFQANAFSFLYNKEVAWRQEDVVPQLENSTPSQVKKVEAVIPTDSQSDDTLTPSKPKAAPAAKLSLSSDIPKAKSAPKIAPRPVTEVYESPRMGLLTSSGTVLQPGVEPKEPEAIIVSEVPIGEPATYSKEKEKIAILKAQQAISKSFLSLGKSLSEGDLDRINNIQSVPEPIEETPAPVTAQKSSTSNFFGFLSPKPAPAPAPLAASTTPKKVEAVKPVEKPEPPVVVAKVVTPVATSKPTPKAEPKPFGGLLSFLESDPNIMASAKQQQAKPKPVEKPPVAAVTPPPAPKKVESGSAPPSEAPSGGFFGLFGGKPADPVRVSPPVQSVKPTVAASERPVAQAKRVETAPFAKKAEPVVAPKAVPPPPAPAQGLFGFFGGSPSEPVKAVPVTEKVEPAVARKVVPAPVAPKTSPAPTPSSGLFGFFGGTPTDPVKEPVKAAPVSEKVEPAVARKVVAAPVAPKTSPAPAPGLFGFFGGSPSEPEKATPVAKKAEAVQAPKTGPAIATKPVVAAPKPAPVPTSSGFFGLLGAKSAETPAVASKPDVPKKTESSAPPPKATSQPVSPWAALAKPITIKPAEGPSMNAKFQLTASTLLKKDPSKLRAFQKATDQFRSSEIDVQQFLTTLEGLFGRDQLETIVQPLVEDFPEKEIAKTLKAAFEKRYKAPAPSSSGGSIFGGLFGGQKPSEPKPAAPVAKASPKPVPVPAKAAPLKPVVAPKPVPVVAAAKSAPVASKPTEVKPAPVIVSVSVPLKVPGTKRAFVEDQMKRLASGGITPNQFYENITKSIGKPLTKEILSSVVSQMPKEIGSKLGTISAADK